MTPPDADHGADEPDTSQDPEVTSAADANWLAELRATAKGSERSLADVLDDDASATIQPPAEPDDEATIGDADALAEIRAAVRAARAEASEASDVTEVPEAESTTIVDEPSATDVSHPSDPGLAPPAPEMAPAAPDISPTTGDIAPPVPDISPAGAAARPLTRAATAPTQRWESPARLSTAASPDAPRLNLTTPQNSRADWRIVAGAVVVALLIGFFVARALTGGSDAPEVDPDGSVVQEEGVDNQQVDE